MKNVVYKIENLKSSHFYIGSAEDFKARRRGHLHQLRKGKHHSPYLQRAFNKYGEDWLQFTVIEHSIADSKLLEGEQYYIDTLKPQYNIAKVAGSRKGCKMSAESLKRMADDRRGKSIHTVESRAAIAEAKKGNTYGAGNQNKRKVTPEIIQQVAELRASGLGCRKPL